MTGLDVERSSVADDVERRSMKNLAGCQSLTEALVNNFQCYNSGIISPSFTFGQFILIMPIMDERRNFCCAGEKMLQLLTASPARGVEPRRGSLCWTEQKQNSRRLFLDSRGSWLSVGVRGAGERCPA